MRKKEIKIRNEQGKIGMVVVVLVVAGLLSLVTMPASAELEGGQYQKEVETTPVITTPTPTPIKTLTSTDWSMFRHDQAHTGQADCEVELPLEILWKYKTGVWISSSPAVADGVVYVGSADDYVYALDANSGSEKWKYKTGGWVKSSPAVADGVVYVGTHDDNVYAFATKSRVEAPTAISKAQSEIASAHSGADTTEAQNFLNPAKTALENKQYQEAINYANPAKTSAENAKTKQLILYGAGILMALLILIGIVLIVITSHRKGAPNLTLSMTTPTLKALKSGELTLHVKNTGHGYANADPISIAVTPSNGIEILTEPTINPIPKQSSTELDIPIKALKAGKQSVSVEVTCEDYSKSVTEKFVVHPPEPELIAESSVPAFLQVGEDNVVSLKLQNTGMVVAKNIVVSVLHPVEIDCISKNEVKIEKIDPGSDRVVPFKLNPSVAGQINIGTFKLSFEDLEDKTYNKSIEIGTLTARTGPSTPIPTEEVTLAKIEIKRGYEVLQNNDLRFGIRVINNTDYAIMDVETILDYPKTLFSMKDNVVQSLANIDPHGKRTAEYILTPLGCIHNEKIDATITYKDHTGEKQAVQMRSKEVHCVCPFLKEKAMREGEFAELANTCEHIQEGLSFSGISVNEITEFIKDACAHRLYVISEHEIDSAKIVYFAAESIGEKAYYLLTAVIQPFKNFTQVALRAYSDKPYGLHGFLNEIGNSIRHLVGSVQSAKEVGVIESKQVINIIDSVVQRTNFGGAGAGAANVNIEDCVVQRSEIGAARRCPNCGKEVQADEKFCPECGAWLE